MSSDDDDDEEQQPWERRHARKKVAKPKQSAGASSKEAEGDSDSDSDSDDIFNAFSKPKAKSGADKWTTGTGKQPKKQKSDKRTLVPGGEKKWTGKKPSKPWEVRCYSEPGKKDYFIFVHPESGDHSENQYKEMLKAKALLAQQRRAETLFSKDKDGWRTKKGGKAPADEPGASQDSEEAFQGAGDASAEDGGNDDDNDDLAQLLKQKKQKEKAEEEMEARVTEEMHLKMDNGLRVNPALKRMYGT
jgi:hypothetical protein